MVANSAHRALIYGKYWECSCQSRHHIRFILDPNFDFNEKSCRVIVTTAIDDDQAKASCNWEEMEVESLDLAGPVPTPDTSQKKNVGLPVACWEHQMCSEPDHKVLPAQISSICSILRGLKMTEGQRELVGFLSDKSYHHYMYVVRKASGRLQSQTLEEIILSSPLFPWVASTGSGLIFNRRDRLHLAVELARSVIQFHGNWLRVNWSSRDILFPKGPIEMKELLQPFLVWSISNCPDATASHTNSSVVRNKTLFPLGLALIELSLCRTITALRIPEDENPDNEVALLKTANRCLGHVYVESGTRYGDVVQQCLSWPHTRETNLDNEVFQDTFFQYIISPLLDDVEDFDGCQLAGGQEKKKCISGWTEA